MGLSKKLYEEWLDEQELKAAQESEARQLIDADGYHMVNCLCDECVEQNDRLERLMAKDD